MKKLQTVGDMDYNAQEMVRNFISYIDNFLYLRHYLDDRIVYKIKIDGYFTIEPTGDEDWFSDLLVMYYDKLGEVVFKNGKWRRRDGGDMRDIRIGKVKFISE